MIVIDVGCARYGGDYSIERLIEIFKPDELFGFDPHWKPGMVDRRRIGQTNIWADAKAAWIYDGEIGFFADGLGSHIIDGYAEKMVPCIDLAKFILSLPAAHEVVLKLDAEGAEYPILERIIHTGADQRLKLVWVEWHCPQCGYGIGFHRGDCERPEDPRRADLTARLACPVEEWRY